MVKRTDSLQLFYPCDRLLLFWAASWFVISILLKTFDMHHIAMTTVMSELNSMFYECSRLYQTFRKHRTVFSKSHEEMLSVILHLQQTNRGNGFHSTLKQLYGGYVCSRWAEISVLLTSDQYCGMTQSRDCSRFFCFISHIHEHSF